MQNKDKSNIVNEYSKIQQGPLVGRGNEVLTRAGDMKDSHEQYADSLDTPSLNEVEHGENYDGKEYHGI